ncbi:MAG TPA: glycosyltransferase family 4 protein [Pyrinomonadaceae bacterium]|nr:glycosyltransferase family 4 protein [Pyrinomonadaceae bacterium]
MTKIAILSPSLSTGDAVTNDVLGMADALTRQGHNVRLFCETHALDQGRPVYHSSRLEQFVSRPDDILIYHYSRGWQSGIDLLASLKCRKVIKYHNVTPAHFFRNFSSSDEQLCVTGREQLKDLILCNCDLYLSASGFNMHELIALGAPLEKSFVTPPFHRIDRLASMPADQKVIAKYSDGKTNVLSVGRIAPHKGHLTLLEAFAQYYFNCNRNSRLVIVGKGGEGLSNYARLLHRATELLGLQDAVVFTGGVSEEALKAFYMIADAFTTTSEHEGFCVPLVEAMSMELPISAFACAAIPETVGDAGILWERRDVFLMAETLDFVLTDRGLKKMLGERALKRYQEHFTPQQVETSFRNALSLVQ